MSPRDPVLTRLSELPVPPLSTALGVKIRRLAQPKLIPRPLSPLFTLAVSASVLGYLGWALAFTAGLLGAR